MGFEVSPLLKIPDASLTFDRLPSNIISLLMEAKKFDGPVSLQSAMSAYKVTAYVDENMSSFEHLSDTLTADLFHDNVKQKQMFDNIEHIYGLRVILDKTNNRAYLLGHNLNFSPLLIPPVVHENKTYKIFTATGSLDPSVRVMSYYRNLHDAEAALHGIGKTTPLTIEHNDEVTRGKSNGYFLVEVDPEEEKKINQLYDAHIRGQVLGVPSAVQPLRRESLTPE